MNLFLSFLISVFSYASVMAHQITATVVFENFSEHTSISGVFYILQTNQTIPIHSIDSFTIELPKKGKYQFEFYSEDVDAVTYYPVRITDRKNTVTIRLKHKIISFEVENVSHTSPLKDISNFSNEQIEAGITDGSINFIFHGLTTLSPEAVNMFKEEFGVGFISQNCVVDPISFKIAMVTNKKIELFLNGKFGDRWKVKLPGQPFGLKAY